MALITITFSFPINVSVDVGDIAYVAMWGFNVGGNSGSHTHSDQSDILPIGRIEEIQPNLIDGESFIVVDDSWYNPSFSPNNTLATGDFIMFSKDNKANLSSLLGYYAKIKMINDSTIKSELFSVGSEVTQSSK